LTVRELVPKRLQESVRRTYVQVGTATGRLRSAPDFLVIGAHRCGTTSLFKALAAHPQLLRPPVNKGTDYFTLHYDESLDWYRGHFPLARLGRARTARYGGPLVFEACTYYQFHPFAMERIARDLPSVKLVVMLRDPVERAFSAYKHERARGFEWEESFERALELEEERMVGEVERMRTDVTYESFAHRHHAYRLRGHYAEQMSRVLELFPREQLHVLESESFFQDPGLEYGRLLRFLGAREFEPPRFDQHNARPSSPMKEGTRSALEAYYAPHDEQLAELLGRPPVWAQST
jgi:Sulfotransferase domain